MIYQYKCKCGAIKRIEAKAFNPPSTPICHGCGNNMKRDYGALIRYNILGVSSKHL